MSTRIRTSAPAWVLCAVATNAGAAVDPAMPAGGPDQSVEQDSSTDSGSGYQDRLIDGGNLPAQVSADGFAGRSPDGWPRALFAEGITSRVTRGDADVDESGLRFGGILETPAYGSFTLDAILRHSSDDAVEGSGSQFTLVQRNLPMNGGWFVDNALGVTNTPASDLARRQYRFYVPTIPMNGAATVWRMGAQLEVHASVGEPGLFTGIYLPTFDGLGGIQASGGLQWNFADAWSAAVQMVDMDRVRLKLGDAREDLSTRSWFGALSWSTDDAMTQANVVQSTINDGSSEVGGWVDAAMRTGRTWHTVGGFYLNPDLIWANQPLPSDSQGGYYRAAYQSRQWQLDGGVDYVAPVSGPGDATTFGTGYARYQYSTGLGIGAGANYRHSGSDAWSAFGFADAENRWGIGRGQLGYARDDSRDGTQLTLDQTWNTQAGRRLSTAIAIGRENLETYSANTLGLAVYGGGSIVDGLSLDLNARWDSTFGDASTNNWLANAALVWSFASGWTATANFYGNRGSGRLPLAVESPIPGEQPYERLRADETGFYVSLRYDWRAGTPTAPLGGRVGSGSGSISGVLFLDANDNGRRDAGEAGAGNVVVVLDGRFQARTNADGRFEFPTVVTGTHFLTVVPDNLPLAWTVPSNARVEVSVGVRSDTRVELPARRLR